jgi:hypothetical protein
MSAAIMRSWSLAQLLFAAAATRSEAMPEDSRAAVLAECRDRALQALEVSHGAASLVDFLVSQKLVDPEADHVEGVLVDDGTGDIERTFTIRKFAHV